MTGDVLKFKEAEICINGTILTESQSSTIRSALTSLHDVIIELASGELSKEYVEREIENIKDIRDLIYPDENLNNCMEIE